MTISVTCVSHGGWGQLWLNAQHPSTNVWHLSVIGNHNHVYCTYVIGHLSIKVDFPNPLSPATIRVNSNPGRRRLEIKTQKLCNQQLRHKCVLFHLFLGACFCTTQQNVFFPHLFWPTSCAPGWAGWQSPHTHLVAGEEANYKCQQLYIANLKVISGKKKLEIRDRLVFTWALPRLEYEEVDMLFGWLWNKERWKNETNFQSYQN